MKDKALKTVFSILIKKSHSFLIHLRTGFFIRKNGLFFTAVHTFRKIENEITENGFKNLFIAFPSNQSKLYPIVSLWYESLDIYQQKGPTYKDTAVGIADYNNDNYLIFNRKRPKIGDTLISYGYHNSKQDRQHKLINGIAELLQV